MTISYTTAKNAWAINRLKYCMSRGQSHHLISQKGMYVTQVVRYSVLALIKLLEEENAAIMLEAPKR